jgi:hypothetical protein
MGQSKNSSRSVARRKYWDDKVMTEYSCPDCGRGLGQLRNGFEVHHVDGDATNNDMDNLVGLCRPCHNIREGKKPSINDYQFLLHESPNEQEGIPVIKSTEEENENFKRCDNQSIPVLEIIQKRRRKYATVQIDFSSTGGWKKFEAVAVADQAEDAELDPTDMPWKKPWAGLTERATRRVNAIVGKYEDEKQPLNHTNAPMMNYGVDYTRFPPLLTEVAKELAYELRPVVMDRSNWEPMGLPKTYIWEPVYGES